MEIAFCLFSSIGMLVIFWDFYISMEFLDGEYSILDWIRDELGIEPEVDCNEVDCEDADYREWNR